MMLNMMNISSQPTAEHLDSHAAHEGPEGRVCSEGAWDKGRQQACQRAHDCPQSQCHAQDHHHGLLASLRPCTAHLHITMRCLTLANAATMA